MPTLNELISKFDIPLRDDQFPDLIAALGDEARKRAAARNRSLFDATYFYLLARTYELLGYCARHTPWLSHSPKFYWQYAVGYFDQAMAATPMGSPEHSFLLGKSLLRYGMILTPESKATRAVDPSLKPFAAAEAAFKAAANTEPERTLRLLYEDSSFIAKTEIQQRVRVKQVRGRIEAAPGITWMTAMNQVMAIIDVPQAQTSMDMPSRRSAMPWNSQHALAEARDLNSEARLLEEVVGFLRSFPREHTEAIKTRIEEKSERVLYCYDQSARRCAEAGLTIRAAHTRVTRLRLKADAELRNCRRLFKTGDAARRDVRLEKNIPGTRELPQAVVPLLQSISPQNNRVQSGESLKKLTANLRDAGVRLTGATSAFSDDNDSWVITDGFDRYHVILKEGAARLTDLTARPIPFSPTEAGIFSRYERAIDETCRLYTDAIRAINRALADAKTLYAKMTSHLAVDKMAVNDPDLSTLHLTTEAILKELDSRHYPLLSTLRDRIRYAWSLLEMFQMRNGSVRIDTLFSAQCRLIMANPCFDAAVDDAQDEILEVGADPIFRMTVDFVFRGAKGEGDMHESQKWALRASTETIKQERRSLLSETRWIYLEPETRKSLLERLNCHQSLAEALEVFTPVFVVQRPLQMKTPEILSAIDRIDRNMNAAMTSYKASREYRSKLIDDKGLDALQNYMRGIALVLLGMNQHETPGQLWAATYDEALKCLETAKSRLENAGDGYLLPREVRDDYLKYMHARILTVKGWEARYRARDSDGSPQDFELSAEFFEKSAEVFRELRDYRVATKAAARAKDVRSYLGEGDERRRLLVEANALYAACGNDQGFEDTIKRLEEQFPDDPRSVVSRKVQEVALRLEPDKETEKWIGPYKLMRTIGKGGMAVVYEGRRDGQSFALKTIRKDIVYRLEEIDELRQRFIREVANVRRLDHSNIVRITDSDEFNGDPYFAMELLIGRSLDEMIEERKPFAPKVAAQILSEIADALAYAHSRGIVHRDLKPANVMLLEGNARIKVMDFGIAQSSLMDRLTQTGMIVGTAPYMSPNRLLGRDATYADDLYAVGLIAFQMLTAAPLEAFSKRIDPNYRHPVPSMVVPGIPAALDRIVARLLLHDAAGPYESAGELVTDLKAFVG